MHKLLTFVLLLIAFPQSQSKPPMPFQDWGACPFEGCTYRAWKTTKPVTVWTDRSRHRIAYTVNSGEWVHGLTGVVVTTRPGIIMVLVRTTLGTGPTVDVSPGDLLYTLHYVGEGYVLFWFKDKTYSDQIWSDPDSGPSPPDAQFRVISVPESLWWVKVRNNKGQTGWTNQTDRFTNMDMFGM